MAVVMLYMYPNKLVKFKKVYPLSCQISSKFSFKIFQGTKFQSRKVAQPSMKGGIYKNK